MCGAIPLLPHVFMAWYLVKRLLHSYLFDLRLCLSLKSLRQNVSRIHTTEFVYYQISSSNEW